jgi:hypothetical protein
MASRYSGARKRHFSFNFSNTFWGTETVKKILFAIAFMFSATGIAQAAFIDGETAGTDKHRIVGFGEGDIFVAQGQPSSTTVSLTDVGTPVVSSTPLDTTGLADGFIHDFIFQAVQDTFASITTGVQLSSGNASAIVSPLIMQVWRIVAGVDILEASASLDVGVNPTASEAVALMAGETYVVRMSNEGGSIGSAADYTLNVLTPVPVPAAVWLFGTAMVGLFGLRRKSRMAVAA